MMACTIDDYPSAAGRSCPVCGKPVVYEKPTIGPALHEQWRCETCRWWRRSVSTGACDLTVTVGGKVELPTMAMVQVSAGPRGERLGEHLETLPVFGCVQWEARK